MGLVVSMATRESLAPLAGCQDDHSNTAGSPDGCRFRLTLIRIAAEKTLFVLRPAYFIQPVHSLTSSRVTLLCCGCQSQRLRGSFFPL
jgi:hypothetical protein